LVAAEFGAGGIDPTARGGGTFAHVDQDRVPAKVRGEARFAEVDAFGRRCAIRRIDEHHPFEPAPTADVIEAAWPRMRIDNAPLPRDASQLRPEPAGFERSRDRDRADGITTAADSENECLARVCDQTSAASD
jgi:hypothetical protein